MEIFSSISMQKKANHKMLHTNEIVTACFQVTVKMSEKIVKIFSLRLLNPGSSKQRPFP